MRYQILPFVFMILFISCQTRKADETQEQSSESETDSVPSNEEHIISFQDFHRKYIATGKIGILQLPLKLTQGEGSACSTMDSPEGAFENIPNKNYAVDIYGLLPDTSRYYAIVYGFQMGDYVTNNATGIYSTRIATFSKNGKFIGRAPVIQVGNFSGATSCSEDNRDNDMIGYIDSDLSFFGIHIFTQNCSMDGRIRPVQLTVSSFGNIKEDGTIVSKIVNIDDEGDEDTTALAENLKIIRPDVSAVIRHLGDHARLTPGDLTYFFPTSDLKESPPYTWYTQFYPTDKTMSLVGAVRRISSSDWTVRKRQYGLALITADSIGAPYSFYRDDSRAMESNEPDVSVVSDHFVLIVTTDAAGPTGKYVDEEARVLIMSGNNLVPVNGMSKDELRIQRNWIFARRGLKFKSPELTAYFSRFDWYRPVVAEVADDDLSYEERTVVNVIQGFERQ